MKEICDVLNCKKRASTTCDLCGLRTCRYHSYDFVVDFDRRHFWRIREELFYCRNYRDYCGGHSTKPPRSDGITQGPPYTEHNDLRCQPAHHNFHQHVLPFVRFPPSVKGRFCRTCMEKSVCDCNKELDDGFFPIVRTLQFDGSICGVLECCLLDVDKRKPSRCDSCGKYCCTEHAAYCRTCQRTFCTNSLIFFSPQDPTAWGGIGCYVYGGCAAEHRHKLFVISYPPPPYRWLPLKYL